ncbi:hypothetical protein DS66_03775 [Mesotoga sp. SC_3PWM13N19]|nr:hypothetical protein DS66_03775 [Mesotoga sp. SC_3PWM13N19]
MHDSSTVSFGTPIVPEASTSLHSDISVRLEEVSIPEKLTVMFQTSYMPSEDSTTTCKWVLKVFQNEESKAGAIIK